ncbi:uncharacterized protein LOC135138930 isoform X4 [Zophobas morio]|uniref:uncharacterized protein LOC135138930 isoform X4 n=1 Tax=Zophobas morio TaxID=2755281 RepID=UPI003083EAC6
MSTSPAPLLRLCHFESPFLPLQPYFCYHHEVCCKEGCCSRYEYKYFQSWHFWLGILVFLLLYRYICWYCKRKERNNARQNEDDGNSHVVNLMVSYNNRSECTPKDDDESSDPPPLYNVAIHLPKPSNTDEVPTYEQALAHQ